MVRKMMVCLAMSVSLLRAAEPLVKMPHELQTKIDELQLRDIKIAYEEHKPCVLVSGINRYTQRVAYVAIKYIGSGSTFHWTSFVAVPMYQGTKSMWIEYVDNQIVLLQYNNDVGHVGLSGHYISFDRDHTVVILKRISIADLMLLLEEIRRNELADVTPDH